MSYWRATRHPAPCLFFVLPLLIAYEFGVVAVGGPQSLAVRNGADAWLRWLMAATGFGAGLVAPLLIIIVLFVWACRHRGNPPDDAPSLLAGMAIESVCFALALWALSRVFGPALDALGLGLSAAGPAGAAAGVREPLARLVTYVGAGIYEEVIFRLGCFCGVASLLRMMLVPRALAQLVAAVVGAVAFAAVHHIGAHGEEINSYVFAFRTAAGLFFTGLFLLRGFGVTVGTHACYDVLVGMPF
jgi:hypothetical protein